MGKTYRTADIYKTLQEEIISLRIRPREMLSENSLAERFGVSRTIIRGVLLRLQENGFVRILPHVGTQVTGIDLDEVNDFIYMRTAVESSVLRDFLRICSPLQCEEMRYRLEELENMVARIPDVNAMSEAQTAACIEEDLRFHECYFRFTNRQRIWRDMTRPLPGYSRFIRLDMLEGRNLPEVLEEHKAIMDIVDARATDRIEECLSHHLNGGVRRLGKQIFADEYKGYFTGRSGQTERPRQHR